MSAAKFCEGCGQPFERKASNDDVRWARQRYCSQRCGLTTAGYASGYGGGAVDSETLARKSADVGSAALRERILAMFAKTANRRGVSLEEAARLHLCPRMAA